MCGHMTACIPDVYAYAGCVSTGELEVSSGFPEDLVSPLNRGGGGEGLHILSHVTRFDCAWSGTEQKTDVHVPLFQHSFCGTNSVATKSVHLLPFLASYPGYMGPRCEDNYLSLVSECYN